MVGHLLLPVHFRGSAVVSIAPGRAQSRHQQVSPARRYDCTGLVEHASAWALWPAPRFDVVSYHRRAIEATFEASSTADPRSP